MSSSDDSGEDPIVDDRQLMAVLAVVGVVFGLILPGGVAFAALYALFAFAPERRRWVAPAVALEVGIAVYVTLVVLVFRTIDFFMDPLGIVVVAAPLLLCLWLWFSNGGRIPAVLLIIFHLAGLADQLMRAQNVEPSIMPIRALLGQILLQIGAIALPAMVLLTYRARRLTPGESADVFD